MDTSLAVGASSAATVAASSPSTVSTTSATVSDIGSDEHEHGGAALKPAVSEERLPRGQSGERQGRRGNVIDACRAGGQVAGLDGDELGGSASRYQSVRP